MGGLFGGGGGSSSSAPAPKPASALDEPPRAMPDPDSPVARRVAVRQRAERSRTTGRASTNLTGNRRRGTTLAGTAPYVNSALGQV